MEIRWYSSMFQTITGQKPKLIILHRRELLPDIKMAVSVRGANVTREEFCKLLCINLQSKIRNTVNPRRFLMLQKANGHIPMLKHAVIFLTGYANPFGGRPAFHPYRICNKGEDIAVALVRMMGYTEITMQMMPTMLKGSFLMEAVFRRDLLPYVSIACEKG